MTLARIEFASAYRTSGGLAGGLEAGGYGPQQKAVEGRQNKERGARALPEYIERR